VGEKRKDKKRQKVIEFIKNNPFATQREINTSCKTHLRDLFKKGIFDAYKGAGIVFPYKRLVLHGTAIKAIKQRAEDFEKNIAIKLSGYGNANRLIKTKRGFADIVFERKGQKAVIEVKDYEAKDISISQVKQLNKYLEDCNCELGFLICRKKPKKDKFLIGKNKIFILEDSEISKIPELMGL
jgi:Holliday junction resolvase